MVQTMTGFGFIFGNIVTLIGGILFSVTVLTYLGEWGSYFLDVVTHSLMQTKASILAHELQGLTNEAIGIVRSQGEVSLGLRLTARGPRMFIHSTMVPLDFVKFEFLPRCYMDQTGATHTAPIGSWSEGKTWKDYGSARTLAREFTQHLVANGLAVWGAGNQSAQLVGDLSAFELRKMLGMIDRSIQMDAVSDEAGEGTT